MVKLNPVDGLPEWKGRRIITEVQKRHAAKRARRFVMIEWDRLMSIMAGLKFTRPQRLIFVLLLHENLQSTRANNGWIKLERKDLFAAGLADSNFYKVVAELEALGLVEVQRRPGKRALVRLMAPQRSSDAEGPRNGG
jgi:Cdc6-like AAA superfamily ATPase